jgi:hypothetical protein
MWGIGRRRTPPSWKMKTFLFSVCVVGIGGLMEGLPLVWGVVVVVVVKKCGLARDTHP